MGKGDDSALVPQRLGDKRGRALVALCGRLAAGAAVVEELPVGAVLVDLGCGQALVVAVVVLAEQVREVRIGKPGQLSGATCALER